MSRTDRHIHSQEWDARFADFPPQFPGRLQDKKVLASCQRAHVYTQASERQLYLYLLLPYDEESFSLWSVYRWLEEIEDWEAHPVEEGFFQVSGLDVRQQGPWVGVEVTFPLEGYLTEPQLQVALELAALDPELQETMQEFQRLDAVEDTTQMVPSVLVCLFSLIGGRVAQALARGEGCDLEAFFHYVRYDHEALQHACAPSGFLAFAFLDHEISLAMAESEELLLMGEPEAAGDILEELLRCYPTNGRLLECQGRIMLEQGDPEEAIRTFARALEDSCFWRPDRAYLGIAKSHAVQQRWQEAMRALEQGLAKNPYNLDLLLWQAYLFRELGEFETSLQVLTQVEQREPTYRNLHLERGYTYLAQDRPQRAFAAFQQEVEEYPDQLEAIEQVLGLATLLGEEEIEEEYNQRKKQLELEENPFMQCMLQFCDEEDTQDDPLCQWLRRELGEDWGQGELWSAAAKSSQQCESFELWNDAGAEAFLVEDEEFVCEAIPFEEDEEDEAWGWDDEELLVEEEQEEPSDGLLTVDDSNFTRLGALQLWGIRVAYEGGTYRVNFAIPEREGLWEQVAPYACHHGVSRLLIEREAGQILFVWRLFPSPVLDVEEWCILWSLQQLPLLGELLDPCEIPQTASRRWDHLYRRLLVLMADTVRDALQHDEIAPLAELSAWISQGPTRHQTTADHDSEEIVEAILLEDTHTIPESPSTAAKPTTTNADDTTNVPRAPKHNLRQGLDLVDPMSESFGQLLRALFLVEPGTATLALRVGPDVQVDEQERLPGLVSLPTSSTTSCQQELLAQVRQELKEGDVFAALGALSRWIDLFRSDLKIYQLKRDVYRFIAEHPQGPFSATLAHQLAQRAEAIAAHMQHEP